jgi:transposase
VQKPHGWPAIIQLNYLIELNLRRQTESSAASHENARACLRATLESGIGGASIKKCGMAERFGVDYCERSVGTLLKKFGFS